MSTFSAVFCQSTVWGQLVSKCLKRTDFVYRCPSILIVESTKVKWVTGRYIHFSDLFCANLDYLATVENPEHLENFSIQIIFGGDIIIPCKKITYMVRILYIYVYLHYIYTYIMHPENEYNLRKSSSNLCHQPAK